MNISYKLLLDKRHVSKKAVFPVKFRIFKSSAYKEINLGFKIPETDWDAENGIVRKCNPKADIYNSKIQSVGNKIKKLILLSELNDEHKLTLEDVLESINPKISPETKPLPICFIEYAETITKNLEAIGKAGNSIVYLCAVNKLKSFIKKSHLPMHELTYKLLTDFNDAMLIEGVKVNTISIYMRTIRAIYNKAIKEGKADYGNYPFKIFKIKSEKTISRTLTIHELKTIVAIPLQVNEAAWHWRNVFLLSFYLIGINMADLLTLKEDNIIDGRVVFRRKKTGKVYSIKIQQAAQDILYYYRAGMTNRNEEYILPFIKVGLKPMEQRKAILQSVHTCNNYLKKLADECNINKPISTYYARYSWANIARQLGYSKDMIAEGLGHEYGNRVTGIYLDNYDSVLIDEMNEKVIEVVKR